MNERFSQLPFDERVKLCRAEINRARPLLKKVGKDDMLDEIEIKWGLHTRAGREALLKPYIDKIIELEEELEKLRKHPLYFPESIICNITNFFEKWKKKR